MEENLNQKKFDIKVPFNNEVMVAARKKTKLSAGIGCLVVAALFFVISIVTINANNSTLAATLIFAGFGAFALAASLCFLLTIKPNAKNDNKVIRYCFYDAYLQIHQINGSENGKEKMLASCLYGNFEHKQYISDITEFDNRLQVKIFTGTYNGVPQYATHVIPKSAITGENELDNFKNFLKKIFGSSYIVK